MKRNNRDVDFAAVEVGAGAFVFLEAEATVDAEDKDGGASGRGESDADLLVTAGVVVAVAVTAALAVVAVVAVGWKIPRIPEIIRASNVIAIVIILHVRIARIFTTNDRTMERRRILNSNIKEVSFCHTNTKS